MERESTAASRYMGIYTFFKLSPQHHNMCSAAYLGINQQQSRHAAAKVASLNVKKALPQTWLQHCHRHHLPHLIVPSKLTG